MLEIRVKLHSMITYFIVLGCGWSLRPRGTIAAPIDIGITHSWHSLTMLVILEDETLRPCFALSFTPSPLACLDPRHPWMMLSESFRGFQFAISEPTFRLNPTSPHTLRFRFLISYNYTS